MLDVAWPELLIVGAVALVAVGPKDLPKVMYALGRMAGKARAVMHDFRVVLDQVSHEAEAAVRQEAEKSNRPEEYERECDEDAVCPPPLEGGVRGGVHQRTEGRHQKTD